MSEKPVPRPEESPAASSSQPGEGVTLQNDFKPNSTRTPDVGKPEK